MKPLWGLEFTETYKEHKFEDDYYYLPNYALHRPAVQCILNNKYYEPDTHNFLKEYLKDKKGSMIHAGTFYGDMIPSFSKLVTELYAFEPVLENYILSRLCVEKNNLKNVILINSALTSLQENVLVNTGIGESLHRGGTSQIDNKGYITPGLRIDQILVKDLLVIHLDVEGHELEALKGGEETIKKYKPLILIEDNRKNCNEFLFNLNYKHIKSLPELQIWLSY